MSKFMYGVEYLREFDPQDPDHVARKDRLCELPSGPRLLPDAFDAAIEKCSSQHCVLERPSQGVDRVQQEVLHRSHQPVDAVRLRGGGLAPCAGCACVRVRVRVHGRGRVRVRVHVHVRVCGRVGVGMALRMSIVVRNTIRLLRNTVVILRTHRHAPTPLCGADAGYVLMR